MNSVSETIGRMVQIFASTARDRARVHAGMDETGRDASKPARLQVLVLVLILLGAALLYLSSLSPERFGSRHDDGIYVVTAKAMAEGEGYRILSLPYEPAQTKYPPLYPALLSLIWRAMPEFPSNILPMMMLSVMATVVFLALSYRYLVREGYAGEWQAVVIVGLVAFNWRTIILGTSIYSEMVYAAMSVMALYLAEKYESESRGRLYGVITGVMIGLCFLTRSAGVALIAAVAGYYLLGKRWKRGIIPVAIASLFVVGWIIWVQMNKTAFEGENVAYYTTYPGHIAELVEDKQATSGSSSLVILLGIVWTNLLGAILVSVPVVCLGIDYHSIAYLGFVFIFIAAGFIRQIRKGARILHLYVLCYLGLLLFWLPNVTYDRLLIPLLPLLLLYLVTEIESLALLARKTLTLKGEPAKKFSAALIALAVLLSIGVVLYNYGLSIRGLLLSASFKKQARPPVEDAQAIRWIKANTDPADVLVSYRDPLYYLYTTRKATRSFAMRAGLSWNLNQQLISKIVREHNARYLVVTSTDFDIESQPEAQRENFKSIIENTTHLFTLVYESPDGKSQIYRISESEV